MVLGAVVVGGTDRVGVVLGAVVVEGTDGVGVVLRAIVVGRTDRVAVVLGAVVDDEVTGNTVRWEQTITYHNHTLSFVKTEW